MMTSHGETIFDWPDLRRHYSEFLTHPNSQEENSPVKDYSFHAVSDTHPRDSLPILYLTNFLFRHTPLPLGPELTVIMMLINLFLFT